MHARDLLLTSIVIYLLSGCTTLPPETRIQTKQDCKATPDDCQVEVNGVTGLVPEHLELPKDTKSTIHWQIPNWSPFRFNTPAIVFAANGTGVFSCNPNPAGNERTVVCHDTGAPNDAGYKYTLRLKWLGSPIPDYDPFVWNR
jgi:hypothetical protein